MAQQKRGLGKGLGALIPTGPVPGGPGPSAGVPGASDVMAGPGTGHPGPVAGAIDGAYFQEVPIGAVTANPRQPRQVFDEEALDELVDSIR